MTCDESTRCLRTFVIGMLLCFIVLSLSACGPTEPRIVVKTVPIPTPVSCVPETFPSAPVYPDTDAALRGAVDAAERYSLIAAGRLLRIARLNETETAIQSCREVK